MKDSSVGWYTCVEGNGIGFCTVAAVLGTILNHICQQVPLDISGKVKAKAKAEPADTTAAEAAAEEPAGSEPGRLEKSESSDEEVEDTPAQKKPKAKAKPAAKAKPPPKKPRASTLSEPGAASSSASQSTPGRPKRGGLARLDSLMM